MLKAAFLPVLLFPLMLIGTQNEWALAMTVVVMIALTFWMDAEKGEWRVLLLGVVVGVAVEIVEVLLFPAYRWLPGSLFSMPIWLPLLWGYAFMVVRRAGVMAMASKPHTPNKTTKK